MRSIVMSFLGIKMMTQNTEMEKGFRNRNDDDSRREDLDRKMKCDRPLEDTRRNNKIMKQALN
jgi:hypothetical protein